MNSVVVFSQKNQSSIYPILLPVRVSLYTLGTTTLSLCSVTSFSSSQESIWRTTVDHFGQRIISTASSASIPTAEDSAIFVIISPLRSHHLLAGESSRTFIICMPFGCSLITAPIHSKSPESDSVNSFASFGLKYEVYLSQSDFVKASIRASSRSSFVFLWKP